MPQPPTTDTFPGFDAFVATPLGKMLLATLDAAMPPGGTPEDRQKAAYAALAAHDPQDSVEQMLAAQAVAAHFAAMECFRQAMQPDADPKTADRARGRAATMARTMRDTMRSMAQHRRQVEAAPQPKPHKINFLISTPSERVRPIVPTGETRLADVRPNHLNRASAETLRRPNAMDKAAA